MNKKKIIYIVLGLGALVMIYFNLFPSSASQETLSEIVKTEEVFLVDVRTPSEFAAGSAKGAFNIPLDEVKQRLSEFKGKPKTVVFCRTGNRSAQAKRILEQSGISDVINGGSWSNVQSALEH